MHHAIARQVVARVLAGNGFAGATVAMVLACRLHDDPDCPETLRRTILERALAMPPDQAPAYTNPLNQQAVPEDEASLCAQLVPALIASPADPALGATTLWCLVQLWPHCGNDERPLLRTRLLNGLAARRGDEAAALSTFQLRDWQKRVPTHYGTLNPSVASLRGVMEAPGALEAYLLFAEHLGMEVDLETLCWVLGSLAMQQLQERHDLHGELAGVLLGTTACERLVPQVPSEAMVTLLSQLNHRQWWLRHHGRARPIRKSLDQSHRPFGPAIASGDITLAQRAARIVASQQPGHFWSQVWAAVGEWLPTQPTGLLRLLAVLDGARWRAHDGGIVLDDASAVAAVLAEMAWWRQNRS